MTSKSSISAVHFFEHDYVNAASYDNLRKIASVIDGLKNASRKVVHTILDKKIYDLTKVSQLSAKAGEYADYLHGSLDGVVVTLAQDYLGTNQIPLLAKKGNFGTRAIPEASASRYIFAKGSEQLKQLFNEKDKPNLIQQTFEGGKIEPVFYVPDLPVLLVNGNKGVSSGFAQNILPRSVDELRSIINKYCKDQKTEILQKVNLLKPYIGNFQGSVIRDPESPDVYKWLFTAKWEFVEQKRSNQALQVQLFDMPYGSDLRGFLAVLDKLEEDKKIKSYEDRSEGDSFNFLITLNTKEKPSNDSIIKLLKLQTSVTENFTSIDQNNKIFEAQTPFDLLEKYVEVKLEFLSKRKDYILTTLNNQLNKTQSTLTFIKAVIDNEIDVKKSKTSDFIEFFTKREFFKESGDTNNGFGYLIRTPMGKLSKDEIESLEAKVQQIKQATQKINDSSVFDLWMQG